MYDTFLQQLIQVNMLPICLILFLVLFLRFNDPYEHELTKQFYPILAMILVLIIGDNLDYYSYDVQNNGFLHILVTVIGYNLRITILLALIQVMLANTGPGPKKTGLARKRIFVYGPAVVCLFITCLAFFTHLVFWFDENGEMARGTLAYTPHIVALYYAFLVIAFAFFIRKQFGRSNEALLIILMTVLCLLGTYVEMKYALRGILIGILAMAVTFYYLCLHIEYFKYDILTGALNRTSFLADQQQFAAKGGGMIVSIDLNDLKKLNDEEGHAEGDLALKTLVDCINRSICYGTMLYRVGGDEFALLCRNLDEAGVKDLINRIMERMKETRYSCALGYAAWDGKGSFDEAYERADANMYVNKKESKHSKPAKSPVDSDKTDNPKDKAEESETEKQKDQ